MFNLFYVAFCCDFRCSQRFIILCNGLNILNRKIHSWGDWKRARLNGMIWKNPIYIEKVGVCGEDMTRMEKIFFFEKKKIIFFFKFL